MTASFAVSWIAFRLLRDRLRDDAALFRAVALTAFSAYCLGVAPEISEAWGWPSWTVPMTVMLPLAVLVTAVRPRGKRPSTSSSM